MSKVRQVLEDRRYAEEEIEALMRQIEKLESSGAPNGYPSRGEFAKVPGSDERIVTPKTNNPEGARQQQSDGYREKLSETLEKRKGLFMDAEAVIESLSDSRARTILRNYYCLAKTDEQIAEIMGLFDGKYINKRRRRAVEYLENNFEERRLITTKYLVLPHGNEG